MKHRSKVFLLSVLFFFIAPQVQAQCGQNWEWQYPLPQGNWFYGVENVDRDTAIAVGTNGTIMRTQDAGGSWEIVHCAAGTQKHLRDIDMVDERRGWAVGEKGSILRTTNGGDSWVSQSISNTGQDFVSVSFVDSLNGWACSHDRIYHTDDGGSSWTTQSSTLLYKWSIHFTDSLHGWCVGGYWSSDEILYTKDGGATWKTQTINLNVGLRAVHFVDSLQGWAVGEDSTVIHTDDGGSTWKSQKPGISTQFRFVHFLDSTEGWIGGAGGGIAYTSNGGSSWKVQKAPGPHEFLYDLHFSDAKHGWSVGNMGTIQRSNNGGMTWDSLATGIHEGISSAHFIDSLRGWGLSGHHLFRTTDGGDHWNKKEMNASEVLNKVHFADSTEGWVVGQSATLMHSNDGGDTWYAQYSPATFEHLNDIHFTDPLTGWIAGEGILLRTKNGGSTWEDVTTNNMGNMEGVYFLDASHGWIVGDGGDILHTHDGGSSWDLQYAGHSVGNLLDVHFADTSNGWAVGIDEILHTDNGGDDWSIQKDSLPSTIKSVHFLDASTGYAASVRGILYSTTDGGENWHREHVGANIGSIYFTCDSTGWLMGSGILHNDGTCSDHLTSINDTVCGSYTAPSGDTSYSSSGTYWDTIPKCGGCKRIFEVDLTIPGVEDPKIHKGSDTLIAKYKGAERYQWLDCDSGMIPIDQADGRKFPITSDGSYAVKVSKNGCTDTSDCATVQALSLYQTRTNKWSVRPNPTSGDILIQAEEMGKDVELRLTDIHGRTIIPERALEGQKSRLKMPESPGVYFLHLEGEGWKEVHRVIKE